MLFFPLSICINLEEINYYDSKAGVYGLMCYAGMISCSEWNLMFGSHALECLDFFLFCFCACMYQLWRVVFKSLLNEEDILYQHVDKVDESQFYIPLEHTRKNWYIHKHFCIPIGFGTDCTIICVTFHLLWGVSI